MHTTTHLAAEVMRSGTADARVAHSALFERVLGRIHRYFHKMVWDRNEAEECVQRTLLLIEESLAGRKYDPDRSFNTWLWLKARTVYAQWCRDRSKAARPLGDADEALPAEGAGDDGTSPVHEEATDRRLDAETVLREVEKQLGEETYEAFVLYYEGGLKMSEVAEAIGRDRKTVRKRIDAAHELIDKLLDKA